VAQADKPKEGQSAFDSAVDAPHAGFMNLQVPPELEAKLTRLATETGRSVDQVAHDLLASSIDHDEWFRTEVGKGRASGREGTLLEHDDVAARPARSRLMHVRSRDAASVVC
jgi:predicted transcriptional regulator